MRLFRSWTGSRDRQPRYSPCVVRRRGRLIGLDLFLVLLAVLGVLQAAAKDDTSTVEGIVFWISLLALPIRVGALLVLLILGARRRRSRRLTV